MTKTQKRADQITTSDRTYPSRYTLTSRQVTAVRRLHGRIQITHANAAGQRFTNTYSLADIIAAAA